MIDLLCVLLFLIFWTYIFYPLFLYSVSKIKKNSYSINSNFEPSVSIVIVAHNEERVIKKTIESCLSQRYPKNKIEIVIASDHSTDKTNAIAESYSSQNVRLVQTKERKGRANAHNEACATIQSEIIAFCDANTIWDEDTLQNLVESLSDPKVGFVTGQLKYINTGDNKVSGSEGVYWKYELMLRKLESLVSNITAGNGAVYAIKRDCYESINPLYSHDIVLPSMVVAKGLSAIYNDKAMAYEKAGETTSDEYSRKVRMFGRAWHFILRNGHIFNPLKVGGLYSICMISHRFLRYSAGLIQLSFFMLSVFYFIDLHDTVATLILASQILFYIIIFIARKGALGNKFYTLYYLNLFHLATLVGFYRAATNKVKPFWLSPQTTRK